MISVRSTVLELLHAGCEIKLPNGDILKTNLNLDILLVSNGGGIKNCKTGNLGLGAAFAASEFNTKRK